MAAVLAIMCRLSARLTRYRFRVFRSCNCYHLSSFLPTNFYLSALPGVSLDAACRYTIISG